MSQISTRRLAALLAVWALCCGLLPAQHVHRHGPPKRMEKEQIEQLEAQWKQAMLTDDVTAMDKLLSEDYLGVTAAGDLVTKSQQLDRMRSRKVSVTKLDTTEIKFKLIGQIGIVTSLAQIEAESDGRTITGQYRYTRIYQRLPSGSWKITSFEATRVPGSGNK
jgi:ketosteroid isomerase-like protein